MVSLDEHLSLTSASDDITLFASERFELLLSCITGFFLFNLEFVIDAGTSSKYRLCAVYSKVVASVIILHVYSTALGVGVFCIFRPAPYRK